MPKPSEHALIWSEEHQSYDLSMHGQLQQSFHQQDESVWLAWVQEHTTFAFQGKAGHLSLIKEARPRGSSYWYAYRRQAGRTQPAGLHRLDPLRRPANQPAEDGPGHPGALAVQA